MEIRQPKLFISYASEDSDEVEKIYKTLKEKGFKPWLDTKDILPGQNWKNEISKAINDCDFFILCLSNNSVKKRGIYQVEIREALEIWKQKLDDDIYIIPVRLDECDVPEKISQLQWVDYFATNGLNLILKAINAGMKELNILLQKDWEKINNGILIENNFQHIIFELQNSNPNFFRIARESHFAFFRSIIEALRGTNNLAITGSHDPNKVVKYQYGSDPWKMIKKTDIPGCRNAWRFSEPVPITEPEIHKDQNYVDSSRKETLIDFFDAMAMVQAKIFMGRFVDSKPIFLSNKEMKFLEWLHFEISEEYDHFIPKLYSTSVEELCVVSKLCTRKSKELLFICGLFLRHGLPDSLEDHISNVDSKLNLICPNSV